MLLDTCVWLDLAKDHRQQSLLSALEELLGQREIALVLPQIVVEEFARNKMRVLEESGRSLSSVIKRVKEAVNQFGDDANKAVVLSQLNNIDHRIATRAEAPNGSIARIEALFATATPFATTDEVKLRAADRALEKRAPFHRQRNGIGDAILIETYAAMVAAAGDASERFAFVTHNTKDFSDTAADNRQPHPDIAASFSPDRSRYATSLAEVLNDVGPERLEDLRCELEWLEEPRRLSEILAAMDELLDKVWYNRHWNSRIAIEKGRIRLVDTEDSPVKDHRKRPILRKVWKLALEAAQRIEEKRGIANLGPWTDFEWGMLNGKLSALRWVLGDEWDNLDT